MKKILSILCVLTLCLSANAAGKKVSSSSSASSSSSSSYSSSSKSSSKSASVGHKAGQFGITANLGFSGGSNIVTQPDPTTGGLVTQTTPARTSTFLISAGVTYFVMDKLEIGLDLGYNNTRIFNAIDPVTGGNMFTNNGDFFISPYVGYHIPICNWLHYVPQFGLGLDFGSSTRDLSLNPKQQTTTSSTAFTVGLGVANFEILASEHFSFTLNLGGFNFTTTKSEDKVNNITQVQNTFGLTLFQQVNVGVRYYF